MDRGDFYSLQLEDCKLAMMVCWRLWLNRNDKVWNGHVSRAQNLVNAAGHYHFQWQEARRRSLQLLSLCSGVMVRCAGVSPQRAG